MKNLPITNYVLSLSAHMALERGNMRITVLQTDIVWADAEANIRKAERLMAEAPESDLYVLPEMWSTGFATEPQGIAEEEGGRALQWMLSKANEVQAAVAGSIAVKTRGEGDYVNRHYFVRPDGSYEFYDKHHLFTYGHEDCYFRAGDRRTVAHYKGVRFLLITCYDTRFPGWMRYDDDFDAIIIVANWPANRQRAWQILTRARAIENQCCVVAANRTGDDPYSSYIGKSAIIDAYGNTLAAAHEGREEAISAVVDFGRQQHFRDKFPVLRERDVWESEK